MASVAEDDVQQLTLHDQQLSQRGVGQVQGLQVAGLQRGHRDLALSHAVLVHRVAELVVDVGLEAATTTSRLSKATGADSCDRHSISSSHCC